TIHFEDKKAFDTIKDKQKAAQAKREAVEAFSRDFNMTLWSEFIKSAKEAYGPQFAVQLNLHMEKDEDIPTGDKNYEKHSEYPEVVDLLKTLSGIKEKFTSSGLEKEFLLLMKNAFKDKEMHNLADFAASIKLTEKDFNLQTFLALPKELEESY